MKKTNVWLNMEKIKYSELTKTQLILIIAELKREIKFRKNENTKLMDAKTDKTKIEMVVDGKFSGSLNYGNSGMRHADEEETFYLDKGDTVYIHRK